jgi:DNA replication and repair protein RecF
MIVRSLRLHNFRNYENQTVVLPSGIIAFVGENGQGKTNLLEAICVLATTKSPLVERDRELICWEQQRAQLSAEVALDGERGETRQLEYSWRITGPTISKELRVGGVPQSAIAQWLGQLQVVAFFPHDLVLVTGEPSERRRFLSLEIGKARPSHLGELARYRRALQQRNVLLRQYLEAQLGRKSGVNAPAAEAILEWNRQVVVCGARVMMQRARFLDEIAPLCDAMHRKVSGLGKVFTVQYEPGFKLNKRFISEVLTSDASPEDQWSRLLLTALDADDETDHRKGTTNSGAHRDDLIFKLDGMDLRRYGSQGQQRLAVLALKLALAHWVQQTTGESPILLLDDAFSELDTTRRALVLQEASHFSQSVLTTTDARFIESASTAVFSIIAGQIQSEKSVPQCAPIETI